MNSDNTTEICQTWTPFPGIHVRATNLNGLYYVEVWRKCHDDTWAYALFRDEAQGIELLKRYGRMET